MTAQTKLTKAAVDRIPLTKSGQAYYWDSEVKGFGLRVGTNSKSYIAEWRVKGKTVRVTIGKHGPFTPEQARDHAKDLLRSMQKGVNPRDEKKKARIRGVTVKEAFAEFMAARKSLKPNTVRDYTYCVEKYFKSWRDTPLAEITAEKIAKRHAQLGEKSQARANLAMRFLRALFNFAIEKYKPHIIENPVKHLSSVKAWYRVERRQSYIKAHELQPWFKAVQALKNDQTTSKREVLRDYLVLTLLTGLRRQEAASLAWENVDLKAKTLTVLDTKNRQPHTLPLPDYVIALLKRRQLETFSPFVFSGEGAKGHIVEPRKQILRVCKDSGVEFRVHDLRRTFATVAESLDIPAYALKRLLNHKMTDDVTAGYIVADVERLREPMQKVTDFILKAAHVKKSGQVLAFNAGRDVRARN